MENAEALIKTYRYEKYIVFFFSDMFCSLNISQFKFDSYRLILGCFLSVYLILFFCIICCVLSWTSPENSSLYNTWCTPTYLPSPNYPSKKEKIF